MRRTGQCYATSSLSSIMFIFRFPFQVQHYSSTVSHHGSPREQIELQRNYIVNRCKKNELCAHIHTLKDIITLHVTEAHGEAGQFGNLSQDLLGDQVNPSMLRSQVYLALEPGRPDLQANLTIRRWCHNILIILCGWCRRLRRRLLLSAALHMWSYYVLLPHSTITCCSSLSSSSSSHRATALWDTHFILARPHNLLLLWQTLTHSLCGIPHVIPALVHGCKDPSYFLGRRRRLHSSLKGRGTTRMKDMTTGTNEWNSNWILK